MTRTTETKRIALPMNNGRLSDHFGHSREFAIFEVGEDGKVTEPCEVLEAPEHEPRVLPEWLDKNAVDVVIARGVGRRAVSELEARGIDVVVGAQGESAWAMVHAYLAGQLLCRDNICDH